MLLPLRWNKDDYNPTQFYVNSVKTIPFQITLYKMFIGPSLARQQWYLDSFACILILSTKSRFEDGTNRLPGAVRNAQKALKSFLVRAMPLTPRRSLRRSSTPDSSPSGTRRLDLVASRIKSWRRAVNTMSNDQMCGCCITRFNRWRIAYKTQAQNAVVEAMVSCNRNWERLYCLFQTRLSHTL